MRNPDRQSAVHETQEDSDTPDIEFDVVRTKNFNIYSVCSVIIAMLRI